MGNRSINSIVIEELLKISPLKKRFNSLEKVEKHLNKVKKRNSKSYRMSKIEALLNAGFKKANFEDMVYYVINEKQSNKNIMLYIHGGCYVEQPLFFHWRFIKQIAQNTDYTIYVPIYPKAPQYNYTNCYDIILRFYKKIILESKGSNLAFMGDSAGGGFILGFTQYLRNKGLPNAKNVIMLSPWVDMALDNPEIKQAEKVDPYLTSDAVTKMAKSWTNGSDLDNYLLSPINGTFENLGKLIIFVGTHEILLPDARSLKEQLIKANADYEYYEYPNMNHVFPLYPFLPEAEKAKQTIYQILNNSKQS